MRLLRALRALAMTILANFADEKGLWENQRDNPRLISNLKSAISILKPYG